MKTSLDIQELMKHTKAKTKGETIVTAVADYNHRQSMAVLVQNFGTFDALITNEEIEALEQKGNYHSASVAEKKHSQG